MKNWALYGVSHCKDKSYGSAAIVSNTVLFVLVVITIVISIIIFLIYARGGGQARVTHTEERDSLVDNTESSKPPPPKPKPVEEEKEEEYRPEADDMGEGEEEDGIE